MSTPSNRCRCMRPPLGWTLTFCECEARVGGALRLAWKSPDADPIGTLCGVFTEVVPHERMVHTEMMEMASVGPIGSLLEKHEFAEKGGVTTMRITQTYDSKDARDAAIASGADQGMEAGFEQLDAMLAQLAQGSRS